jgi:hypothetical protein
MVELSARRYVDYWERAMPKKTTKSFRIEKTDGWQSGDGLDAETAAWLAGMTEEQRCLAEAEAHRYEALSEVDKDAIWSEDEELIETDSEGDEIELPARLHTVRYRCRTADI